MRPDIHKCETFYKHLTNIASQWLNSGPFPFVHIVQAKFSALPVYQDTDTSILKVHLHIFFEGSYPISTIIILVQIILFNNHSCQSYITVNLWFISLIILLISLMGNELQLNALYILHQKKLTFSKVFCSGDPGSESVNPPQVMLNIGTAPETLT